MNPCLLLLVAFAASTSAVSFDCTFIEYHPEGSPVTLYGCHAEVLLTGSETLESFIGTHLPGKNDSDVNEVSIENQTLTFVPRGMQTFFPNLIALVFGNTELLSISSQDLQPYTNLMMISVFGGNLTTIDANLFEFHPNMVRMYFNRNLIESVGEDAFTNLFRLYFLDMRDNPCTGETAVARTVETVRTLIAELPDMCPAEIESACTCLREISELQETNDQQNIRIDALEAGNADLEARLSSLEASIQTLGSSL